MENQRSFSVNLRIFRQFRLFFSRPRVLSPRLSPLRRERDTEAPFSRENNTNDTAVLRNAVAAINGVNKHVRKQVLLILKRKRRRMECESL